MEPTCSFFVEGRVYSGPALTSEAPRSKPESRLDISPSTTGRQNIRMIIESKLAHLIASCVPAGDINISRRTGEPGVTYVASEVTDSSGRRQPALLLIQNNERPPRQHLLVCPDAARNSDRGDDRQSELELMRHLHGDLHVLTRWARLGVGHRGDVTPNGQPHPLREALESAIEDLLSEMSRRGDTIAAAYTAAENLESAWPLEPSPKVRPLLERSLLAIARPARADKRVYLMRHIFTGRIYRITEGELDDEAEGAFLNGHCHSFAYKMSGRLVRPIYAVAPGDCDNDCPSDDMIDGCCACMSPTHLVVGIDEDEYVDVRGRHRSADLLAEHGSDGRRFVLRPLTDNQLQAIVDSADREVYSTSDSYFMPMQLEAASSIVESVVRLVERQRLAERQHELSRGKTPSDESSRAQSHRDSPSPPRPSTRRIPIRGLETTMSPASNVPGRRTSRSNGSATTRRLSAPSFLSRSMLPDDSMTSSVSPTHASRWDEAPEATLPQPSTNNERTL